MRLTAFLLTCLGFVAALDGEYEEVEDDDEDMYRELDKKQFLGADNGDRTPKVLKFDSVSCKAVAHEFEPGVFDADCSAPVNVYVDIPEDNVYAYYPTKVKVKRCGGKCNVKHACVSTGRRQVKIPVKRTMLSFGDEDCAYAILDEDVGCTCGCTVKKEDCSKLQTYNMDMCECQCDDMEHKESTCLADGKIWHGTACECVCEEIEECSHGYKFNHDTCKCEKNKRASFKKRLRV